MFAELTASRRWRCAAIAVIGAGALVTTTTGWVAAAGHLRSGHPKKIHACIGHGGVLRIATHCTSSETGITWNKYGPVGPRGPAGVAQGYAGRYVTLKSSGTKLTSKFAVITQTPPLSRGTYLATATVNLAMFAHAAAMCEIRSAKGNASVSAQHADAQTPPGSSESSANLALNADILHAVRGDVLQVICRDYRAGSKATAVTNAQINATQVNSLTVITEAN